MAFLNQWGQSTVQSLLEAQLLNADIHILASGGVKTHSMPLNLLY